MDHNRPSPNQHNPDRERLLALLVRRLPKRGQTIVNRLLQPSARWVRMPVGILLIFGSVLFILPVFGLWMLPFGLMLLSEDIAPLRRLSDRLLHWIEHRRPHWMGLPEARASLASPDRNSA